MNDRPADGYPGKLIGGRLCLDFVNTIGNRRAGPAATDHLQRFDDLILWAGRANVLSVDDAKVLHQLRARRPNVAGDTLDRAKRLREAIYQAMDAMMNRRQVSESALATLNQFVAELLAASRVAPAGSRYELAVAPDAPAIDRLLWPIVQSTIAVLTTDDPDRLRECAGHPCGWLFYDTSRGGRRRWCDMADCGNTAKVRRFRARGSAASR